MVLFRSCSPPLRFLFGLFRFLGHPPCPSLVTIPLLWLAVSAPAFSPPPLQDDVDASHADAGREILVRHDWVTLHENNIRYLEKPPLPYWGTAVAIKLFGVHTWRAHLSVHLSVLALALFLYFFVLLILTPQSGLWAAV